MHANTAWYRIKTAIRVGLIINRETRKGQPAMLVPGEIEPEEVEGLPTVEQLQARCVRTRPDAVESLNRIACAESADASPAAPCDSSAFAAAIESSDDVIPRAPAAELIRIQGFKAVPPDGPAPLITRDELMGDLTDFPLLAALRDLDGGTGTWIDWSVVP